MAGNVFEFVSDNYGSNYYCAGPEADVSIDDGWESCTEDDAPHESVLNNPTGPTNIGVYRILRGGSWSSQTHDMATYRKKPKSPSGIINAGPQVGLRCCAAP